MMSKSSINPLLREIPSKYSLVILASKRAHKLDEGVQPAVEFFDSVKGVGRTLKEIETGTVISDPSPEEKRERLRIEREEHKRQREQEQKELKNRLRDEES